MRKLLPIAPLLLYACTFQAEAQPSQPWSAGQDTVLLPIITLASPAFRPAVPASSRYSSSGRPVSGRVGTTSPATVTLRVFNPSPTLALANLKLEWALEVNGSLQQKGATGSLSIAPQHASFVHIPARLPGGNGNEIFLRLRCLRIPLPSSGAVRPRVAGERPKVLPALPILLSEEQLLVQAPAGNTPEVLQDGDLTFTDENDTFTIRSPLIRIEFNKQTGWLQRYEVNGAVLLTDTPVLKSNFWRPGIPTSGGEAPGGSTQRPVADDTGDTAWKEASHDPHLQLFSTSTGSTMIIVRAEYTLPATSCLLHLSYTINAKGEMLVGQQLEADSTQKGEALPCFGMRWLLPADYDSIEYYGLGRAADSSNSDDPIRLHAPWTGIYRDTVGKPSSPDSHQRNTAMVTDPITAIRWIRITGPDGSGLLVTADSTLLNAGALPTAGTMSSAPSVLLHLDSRQPAPTGIPGDNRRISYGLPYGNYRCTYKVSPIISHHAAVSSHP
jgi:beta-galactosidase